MCGIFFSLANGSKTPSEDTRQLLEQRGPDSCKTHIVHKEILTPEELSPSLTCDLTFISTVLALRGEHVYAQPIVDPATQSVLCWNGEAWKIEGQRVSGNDTELILNLLLEAVRSDSDRRLSASRIGAAVAKITGPFAFIFYDAVHSRLFFGRDCLGRRSLLWGWDENDTLKICSICDGSSSSHFKEVGFDGVYTIDLEAPRGSFNTLQDQYQIETLAWNTKSTSSLIGQMENPIPAMNLSVPSGQPPPLKLNTPFIQELESRLHRSLKLRIGDVPAPPGFVPGESAKVAVLFSGGLDCTLLARLCHDILPLDDPIDLLNVAFENPRVAAAAAQQQSSSSSSQDPTAVYEACPDRITGRSAYSELVTICPGRNWRFIAINIPYTETLAHRDLVRRLMRPHNTEMDLSIACALFFASRGRGSISPPTCTATPDPSTYSSTASSELYTTPARVLLSGLGADELFAGYGRHSVAFNRSGFDGLVSEIHLDVSRLGQRNLGRDDRVLSHWGRETRFPYLDEELVAWVLRAPVWLKCGFGLATPEDPEEAAATAGIDAEKMALRLVALRLG
ncbi:hypothetical protein N7468_010371 [Penicillium chermesinum]|uniref:Glutamine amidotransferase type-2 domain-containing protein n=1 Tax=Penicillium chermesinum TaxID=63820 RepID=A0A9W9NCM3_9EURO|nr:uncharacterized protein N7468_010371 [Penicillium chermesinum]KAJ5217363.1 hypothetical protein N7468_010371 [Penicillium chermesinum]